MLLDYPPFHLRLLKQGINTNKKDPSPKVSQSGPTLKRMLIIL